MKTKFQIISADLYNVFVEGNANKQEQARVFLLFFIPVCILYTAFGRYK